MGHFCQLPDIGAQPTEAERLAAFGRVLGGALQAWRWAGRPLAPNVRAEKSGSSPRSAQKNDLVSRITEVLAAHGPQAPGTLEQFVGRSHAPVYKALGWLLHASVIEAWGQTKGRRYALRDGWRSALAEALKAVPDQEAFLSTKTDS
jgi:hypothetical protein